VIGVAVFPERAYYAPPPPRPYTPSYPYDDAAPYGSHAERKSKSAESEGLDKRSDAAGRGVLGEPPASAAPAPSVAEADGSYRSRQAPSRRPGLGTEFGEAMTSPIREVDFVRANASRPSVMLGMRYNDRAGLLAVGIDVDGYYGGPDDTDLRQTANPFPVSQRGYATPPAGWRRRW
jgi:hypothetical protein